MLDFRKNIYKKEKSKLEKFANNKMVTYEEKENRVELDDDFNSGINTLDIPSVINSDDAFQLNGIGGDMGSDDLFSDDLFGDSDGFGGGGGDVEYDVSQDNRHRTGVWWKDFVLSPYYLVVYTTQKIIYDKPNREDFVSILRSLNTITIVTGLSSLFMWIIGLNFIFNLGFQAVVSGIMFLLSFSILKFVLKEEVNIPFFSKKTDDSGSSGLEDSSDFDFGDSLDFGDDALGMSDGSGISLFDDNSEFTFDENTDDDDDEYLDDFEKGVTLPGSPVNVDYKDDSVFYETLLSAYKRNSKYQGVQMRDREEILKSMSAYFVSNTPEFSKWNNVKPRSKEGLNLLYTIYKALTQIQNGFGRDEEEMVIMDMKSNPLMYRVELELPNYFKEKQVKSAINEFENMFKKDESDLEVSIQIVYAKGLWVFKLLRYDKNPLISLGDLFRYQRDGDDTVYEQYLNPKLGQPLLIGLHNSEFPHLIDLEDNTCMTIVAGSGAGKSWFTFALMLNWILAVNPDESQLIIMDKKKSPLWTAFAKSPHVLGHHTDIYKYNDILDEVKAEMDRRKELLAKEGGAESYKGVREDLIKSGNTERLKDFPLLTIVIDEITATMSELESHYKSIDREADFKKFKGSLASLSAEIRSVGMRIVLIGQRSIDTSIPKTFMSNSSIKMAMRMENPSDLVPMFGQNEANSMKTIGEKGMGYFKDAETRGINLVKTTSIGGLNDSQMIALIRTIGMDWVRRSIGTDVNYIERPNGFDHKLLYNRNKFIEETFEEMESGRILNPNKQSDAVLDKSISSSNIMEAKAEVVEYEPVDFGREDKRKERNDFSHLDEDNEDIDNNIPLDISSGDFGSFENNLLDELDDIDEKYNEKIEEISIEDVYNSTENGHETNNDYQPPSMMESLKGIFGKKNKESKENEVAENDTNNDVDLDSEFTLDMSEDSIEESNKMWGNLDEDDNNTLNVMFKEDTIVPDNNMNINFNNNENVSSSVFDSEPTEEDFSPSLEDIMAEEERKDGERKEVIEKAKFERLNKKSELEIKVPEEQEIDEDDDEETDFFNKFFNGLDDGDSNNDTISLFGEDKPKKNGSHKKSIFDTVDDEEDIENADIELVTPEDKVDIEDSPIENVTSIFDNLNSKDIQEAVNPKSIFDKVQEDTEETNEIHLNTPENVYDENPFESVKNSDVDLNIYFNDMDIPDFDSIDMKLENDEIFGQDNDSDGDLDSIFNMKSDEMFDISEFADVFKFESQSIFEDNTEVEEETKEFKQIANTSTVEMIPEDIEKIISFDYTNILDNSSNVKDFEKSVEDIEREKFILDTQKREEERLAFEREKEEYRKRMELEQERLKQKELKIEEAKKQAEQSIKLAKETRQSNSSLNTDTKKISIKAHILKYGSKKGLKSKRMSCEEIHSLYGQQEIQKALDKVQILKDNDFYIATID